MVKKQTPTTKSKKLSVKNDSKPLDFCKTLLMRLKSVVKNKGTQNIKKWKGIGKKKKNSLVIY